MEASALHAPATLARPRAALRSPLLRLRSDEQLVALFRAGHDEAFRVIHDRYRQRLLAYTRQMLPRRQDAEDVLQDVFVRAYSGLRASNRELALRAWLYRVAHNRCIDELRRPPQPSPPELPGMVRAPVDDPIAKADQRELLRRLVQDIRRLPDQQRSALLMRELDGMPYADVAAVLELSVPAVKSLLVRARTGLTRALEARDTACSQIREQLVLAHDRGVRPGAAVKCHLRDCDGCREFRRELRGVSRRFAALVPALGPLGMLANVLGFGGGAGSGAAAGGGGAAVGGAASTGGTLGAVGLASGAGHVATLIAATVVTAGGAVAIQHTITAPAHRHASGAASAAPAVSNHEPAARSLQSAVQPNISLSPLRSVAGPPPATPPSSGTSAVTRTGAGTTGNGTASSSSANGAASTGTAEDASTGAGAQPGANPTTGGPAGPSTGSGPPVDTGPGGAGTTSPGSDPPGVPAGGTTGDPPPGGTGSGGTTGAGGSGPGTGN